MKRIFEYEQYERNWNGIIVAVPKKPLEYDSELYLYGKYINHNNEVEYHRMDYNKEDSDMFSICQLDSFKEVFSHFKDFLWYQFDNLMEFCDWYKTINFIEEMRKDREDKIDKEWIHEKCGTNTPPTSVPERPSVGNIKQGTNKGGVNQYNGEPRPEKPGFQYSGTYRNCQDLFEEINKLDLPETDKISLYAISRNLRESVDKVINNIGHNLNQLQNENKIYSIDEIREKINPGWNTRREKLKDVLKLLELRDLRQNTIDMLMQNITPDKRNYLERQLDRDNKRIEDWLNEEI